VVLAAPGDRRDEDIMAIGRAAAGHFEHYVCRRDDHLRGRKSDEVPQLLRDALLQAGAPGRRIQVIPEERVAVDAALAMAKPGDLVLLFADALSRTWKQVIHFQPQAAAPAGDSSARAAEVPAAAPLEVPAAAMASLEDRNLLIRDERGVRLAREVETAD
jgi:cyanophycin synthetase